MRVLPCLIILISLTLAEAEAQPDTLWTRRLEMSLLQITINAATELSDGDLVVVGSAEDSQLNLDLYVARLDSNGDLRWQRTFGSLEVDDIAYSVVEVDPSRLFVVGSTANNRALLTLGVSLSGDSLWWRSYSTNGQTRGNHVRRLQDGNVAIAGYRMGTDGAHSDIWLLKCRTNGDTLWTQGVGWEDTDVATRVLELPDHSLRLTGHTRSQGAGEYDVCVVRMDSAGHYLTHAVSGTEGTDASYDAVYTPQGILLCGRTGSDQSKNGYLVRTNVAGDTATTRTYWHQDGWAEEQLRGIVERPGGGALCVGWAGAAAGTEALWILALDPQLNVEYSWVPALIPFSKLNGVIPCGYGGYLTFGSITAARLQGFLLRISPSTGIRGVVLEQETDFPLPDVCVALLDSTSYVVTDIQGRFSLEVPPGVHHLVAWGTCVERDTLPDITVPPDSVVQVEMHLGTPEYVCPQTSLNLVVHNRVSASAPLWIHNPGTGALSLWIEAQAYSPPGNWLSVEPPSAWIPAGDSMAVQVQVLTDTTDDGIYDFYGSLTITSNSCPDTVDVIPVLVSVLDADERLPSVRDFTLHPATPNPFNPVTEIAYTLPRAGRVSLKVFDVLGREVAVLQDGVVEAGPHRVRFEGSSLPSGIYVCRLEAEAGVRVAKLVLVK